MHQGAFIRTRKDITAQRHHHNAQRNHVFSKLVREEQFLLSRNVHRRHTSTNDGPRFHVHGQRRMFARTGSLLTALVALPRPLVARELFTKTGSQGQRRWQASTCSARRK